MTDRPQRNCSTSGLFAVGNYDMLQMSLEMDSRCYIATTIVTYSLDFIGTVIRRLAFWIEDLYLGMVNGTP